MNNNDELNEPDLPIENEPEQENLIDNELDEIRNQMHEYKEQLMRAKAELENQRKRMERERENSEKFVIQAFITGLLPAKDSMEKGLDVAYLEDGIDGEALFEGMTSTLKICNESFKAAGVEEINPLGKTFNPELHEAMALKQVDDVEPNIVLSVFQKGYLLNGRLIRPARVEVSAS